MGRQSRAYNKVVSLYVQCQNDFEEIRSSNITDINDILIHVIDRFAYLNYAARFCFECDYITLDNMVDFCSLCQVFKDYINTLRGKLPDV